MEKVTTRMNYFYNEKVILPSENVQDIRDKKRKNIDRLKDGINQYSEENQKSYKLYDSVEQGSIAMSTAINPEYDDFDIDVAIIFEKSNIPDNTEDVIPIGTQQTVEPPQNNEVKLYQKALLLERLKEEY